jgi:hypothetical protein
VTERTVILHYHLFKNAGTSFDGILQKNFPGQWTAAEFPGGDNSMQVAAWIARNPGMVAFSSHTATGPVPVVPGVRIISALFLRDPVARIRSAYLFERRQNAGDAANLGARLASETDFDGYVRGRLGIAGDRQCRDFHVVRLAQFVRRIAPELQRATEALQRLSFVGEVERFGHSMDRFAALVRPVWPGFDAGHVHLNRSAAEEGPAMTAELAALLEANNQLDRKLIAHARETVWKD